MGWTASVLSGVVFAGGAISLAVAFGALRQRPDLMAWPLALLMVVTAGWTIPSAIGFGVADLEWALVWYFLEVPGLAFLPLAYLLFALVYAGYRERLTPAIYAALVAPPALTTGVLWTNSYHSLAWTAATLESVGSASVLTFEPGPWTVVHAGYSYLYILLAFVVFGGVILRSGTVHRRQATLMFLGGAIPTACNVLIAVQFGPGLATELTGTLTAISGVIYWVALFRTDALNLSPAAYQNVPDTFGDGLLVFDANARLVTANEHAAHMLEGTVESGTDGRTLFDARLDELDGTTVTTNRHRHYRLRYEPLTDHRGELVGHAVMVRDITERTEQEQRIEVLNRVLRHNLRNEVNKARGWIDIVATESATSEQNGLEKVRDAMARLETISKKAQHASLSLSVDTDTLVAVGVAKPVRAVVADYQAAYPAATVRLECGSELEFESQSVCEPESESESESESEPESTLDSLSVYATGPDELEVILANLIENAIEHNDRETPLVSVTVEVADESVTFRVADNGPGIPSVEYGALGQAETPLEHTSGLGLWLVYWLVTGMGGELEFERGPSTPSTASVPDSAERGHEQERAQVIGRPQAEAQRGTVAVVRLRRALEEE